MQLFPSLMAATHYTPQQVIALFDGIVDGYHVDIIDTTFSLAIGAEMDTIDIMMHATKKPLWIHLMIQDPYRWCTMVRLVPGTIVTFHWQSLELSYAFIRWLKERGLRPSIALAPDMDPTVVATLYGEIDHIVVMGVTPGYSGQQFLPSVLDTIKKIIHDRNQGLFSGVVAVDGGVDQKIIRVLMTMGVNWCALGSALFANDNPLAALQKLR